MQQDIYMDSWWSASRTRLGFHFPLHAETLKSSTHLPGRGNQELSLHW